MHSRQYISNVEGPQKFCIDLEADLDEVGRKSPGSEAILKHHYASFIQSQETQDFCVADLATLSEERRSRSKIVLLFNTDKRTLRSKI